MATEEQPRSWSKRRRYMYLVSLFCAGVITYILWKELDTKPAETAMMFAFLALITTTGSYVFGAAWDDKNFKR